MKLAKRLLLLLALLALAAACLFAFISHTETQAIADALDAAGVGSAVEGTQADAHFFLVAPTVIHADSGALYVYQFRFTPLALWECSSVGHNGFSIGAAMIDWESEPHFYRKGSTVVQYIGNDQAVLDALEKLLGKPFAGTP